MFLETKQVFSCREEPQVVLQLIFLILRVHSKFEAHLLLPPSELINEENLEFRREILMYLLEALLSGGTQLPHGISHLY